MHFLIGSPNLFLLSIVCLTISCKMSVVAWIERSFGLKTMTADLVSFLPRTEIQGMMTIHIAIHTYFIHFNRHGVKSSVNYHNSIIKKLYYKYSRLFYNIAVWESDKGFFCS